MNEVVTETRIDDEGRKWFRPAGGALWYRILWLEGDPLPVARPANDADTPIIRGEQ